MKTTAQGYQIVFDTPSLLICHCPRHAWLQAEWYGFQDDTTARAGCTNLLELVRQTGATRLLNDSREAFGEWYEAAEWIGRDFMPRLHEEGVEAVAWINAMDWPTRSCVASTMQFVGRPLVTIFDFDQVTQAREWLLAAQGPARPYLGA